MTTAPAFREKRNIVGGFVVALIALAMLTMPAPALAQAETKQAPDIDRAAEQLASLSRAFKAVADRVEPSVVSVIVKARPAAMRGNRLSPQQQEDLLEEFRRRFGLPEDAVPAPRQRDRGDRPDRFEEYDVPREIGAGSGWVWDDTGHVITNNHVVARAEEIEVRFADGETFEAKLIGRDAKTDIAVLKVDRKDLTPAQRASAPVDQGEIVFAFGSPFRYEFSMSQGIVSGKGRQVGILGPGGYENFIQTDAAINPGNSGGPLTNVRGQVVGMNTAIASRTGTFSGIGFAIPMDMIKSVVGQIIDGGKVVRGYLGAYIGDDPKLLRSFGVENGVVLHDIIKDSPAEQSGLQGGDIVTAIDGRPVRSAAELRRTVASIAPGKQTKFDIVRDGRARTVNVELGELPGSATALRPTDDDETEPASMDALRKLGIEGAEAVTREIREKLNLPTADGVVITRVRPNSVAAAEGLRPGMVITHVMNAAVSDVEQLSREVNRHDLKRGVRLKVRLDANRSSFLILSLDEDESDRTG